MSATICTLWGGINFEENGIGDAARYEEAYKNGVFSQYDNALPEIKNNYPEIGVGGGNVGHVFNVDDRDVSSMSNAMFEGRKILKEYEYYYKNYVKGCENSVLIKSADFIGIRESSGMQASVRVIPCCYITGQAAGIAASVSIDDNTYAKDSDVKKIQELISKI